MCSTCRGTSVCDTVKEFPIHLLVWLSSEGLFGEPWAWRMQLPEPLQVEVLLESWDDSKSSQRMNLSKTSGRTNRKAPGLESSDVVGYGSKTHSGALNVQSVELGSISSKCQNSNIQPGCNVVQRLLTWTSGDEWNTNELKYRSFFFFNIFTYFTAYKAHSQ